MRKQFRQNGLKSDKYPLFVTEMNNQTYRSRLLSILPYVVFFLCSFTFFALFADHIFFYQEKSSLFVFSADYLIDNFRQPGSFIFYLGKLITSFYYFPLTGSFIVTLLLCSIIFLTHSILIHLNRSAGPFVPFLTGSALFLIQTNYQFLLFNTLGLLAQLLLFYLTIKFLKPIIAVFILPFWYFLTGGFTWIFLFLFFSWLILYVDRWKKKLTIIAILISITAAAIIISGEILFYRSYRSLLTYPISDSGIGSELYIFLAILIIHSFLPVVSMVRIKLFSRLRIKDPIRRSAGILVLLLTITGISLTRYDRKTNQFFMIEKLFFQGKFNEVISYNTRHPSNNILTSYLNNIALSETGKLNEMLFRFPQSPDGNTLFLKWEIVGEILRKGGYFYFETGMINEAHRWAYEYMVMKGYTPESILMLIKTDLINGNYKTAQKYIRLLQKTLFYRREAIRFEKMLFNEEAIYKDNELGPKKRIRVNTDFFTISDDPYINIERIVATDTLNRVAFEYLIAYNLLKKDVGRIVELLPAFERYGYRRLPLNVEEALVEFSILNKVRLPEIQIRADQSVVQRFSQFLQVFQSKGANLKLAEPALRERFGSTFWYYAFYK